LVDWYAVAGVILGVAGIGATIFITLAVYFRQKKDGEKLQNVVDSINVLNQQEKNRRDRHINWLMHHCVNRLRKKRNDFATLLELLNNFRKDQNDQNLNLLRVRSTELLNDLGVSTIPYITNEIKYALNYINNPWLTNHFLNEFPMIMRPCRWILESRIFVGMTDHKGLEDIADLIRDAINRIDGYIRVIQEEES